MARLNASGTSRQLRKRLFPFGFDGEVLLLLLQTWAQLSQNRNLRNENRITAVFRDALIEAYVETGRNWFVTLEDQITDPTFGTELGRNDLRFYPPDHRGQTVFFAIECKRLRVPTGSHVRHLTKEYVDGMQRFVTGPYANRLPTGAMVGYVIDGEIDQAFADVQAEIASRQAALKMTIATASPCCALAAHNCSADTDHQRTPAESIRLHHLLLGCAAI